MSLPLSVVVPTRNGASTIGAALTAIRASVIHDKEYELIVVDDGSSDQSATIAARYADIVVRFSGRPRGPGYIRNRGAEIARGDIIAFVDQDVVVGPQTLGSMLAVLAAEPHIAGVSACHGARPDEANFISRYWTLLLQCGEKRYAGISAHFDSACGAVRRAALISAGMYDEWRFESWAGGLESLELGQRLRADGRGLLLSRDLEVTHLTRWNFAAVCREVWERSVALARSLGYRRTRASTPSDVVFTLTHSALPGLLCVAILILTGSFLSSPFFAAEWTLAGAAILLSNLTIARYYIRDGRLGFALAAVSLHLIAQGVAFAALCTGWLLRNTVGDRLPEATIQAYSEVGLDVWPPVPRRS